MLQPPRISLVLVSGIALAVLLLIPFTAPGLRAQSSKNGQPFFTLELQGAYASGFSSSMRGTNAEFRRDLQSGFNNAKYPFGDPNAFGIQFGLEAAYRFRNSQFGIYSVFHATGFESFDKPSDTQFGDTAFLAMATFGIGGEYYYDIIPAVDLRGRLGVNFSRIGGSVDHEGSETDVTKTSRLGLVTRGGGMMPTSAPLFDTCHNMLTLSEQWASSREYDAAYDTIRFYMMHCYSNANPRQSFSDLNNSASGATALQSEAGRLEYRNWILNKVLRLRNDDGWFCWGVLSLPAAYDHYNSDWPAALAILQFVANNPRCASLKDYIGSTYADERQQQIHLWQDTAKNNDMKNFDSTLPSMHDLGLDTLLSMASVQRYDPHGPTILEDVRLLENPTAGETSLKIKLGREAYLHIDVLDLLGRKLDGVGASGVFEPGTRTVPLNLFGLASGTYYVRMYTANNEVRTLKLLKSK